MFVICQEIITMIYGVTYSVCIRHQGACLSLPLVPGHDT